MLGGINNWFFFLLLNLNNARIKGVEVKGTRKKDKRKLKFISLEFSASSGGPKERPSGVHGFRSFLSSTVLFAPVQKCIPKKKRLCLSQST